MRRSLRSVTAWLCLSIFCGGSAAWAQGLTGALHGAKEVPSAPSAQPPDPLKRTSPQSSIRRFLEACHAGKYDLASQYLDLRKIAPAHRASQGPELARELGDLLDWNTHFEVSKLSESPDGNVADGLPPSLDNLAAFQLNDKPVNLQLERADSPNGQIWLVSSGSVAQIGSLSTLVEQNPIEKRLPAVLVNITFVGTPLWIWIALVLLALVISAVSRLLSVVFIAALRPITKRYIKSLQSHRLEELAGPLRLLLSVIVFRAGMAFLNPSALLRDYLLKLLALLFLMGAASLFMRLVDVISDTVISRLDHRERALTYSVIPLGIRVIKIVIFCIALLLVLEQWNYNISAILAGLGVGGLAVALAAQKTVENLFGGVSLISDRPVLVGDFCQFGGQVGTVEDIGLRSTRIRTLDRTVVTIPNASFSTMTLENFSKRDRMWFHPTVRLRLDTPPDQIKQMMNAITDIFKGHDKVDPTDVPVRFTKINQQSLDLDLFAYVLSPDYNEYLRIQSELLLQILEAGYKLGIGFAVPFQEEYNVSVDREKDSTRFPFLAFQSAPGLSNGSAKSHPEPVPDGR